VKKTKQPKAAPAPPALYIPPVTLRITVPRGANQIGIDGTSYGADCSMRVNDGPNASK
jgi:hypothetical protein